MHISQNATVQVYYYCKNISLNMANYKTLNFFLHVFYEKCIKILCDITIYFVLKICYHIIINIYVFLLSEITSSF